MSRLLPMYVPDPLDSAARAKLDLQNRAPLSHRHETLVALSARLSADAVERRQFVADPQEYLRTNGMLLNSARLMTPEAVQQPTEACTLYVYCAAAAALVFVYIAANFFSFYNYTYCKTSYTGCELRNPMPNMMDALTSDFV